MINSQSSIAESNGTRLENSYERRQLEHSTPKIPTKNLVLVGHGHVGKTTLGELLLFKSGVTKKVGSVDQGTSTLDVDDEERRHHFTLFSHTAHFDFQGLRINLLDTPGYPDFLGQVIGPMAAVENAVVVIDAHKGIEVNTRKVWQVAERLHLARWILINKCDVENMDYASMIQTVQAQFGSQCLPLVIPNATGISFRSVIDVLDGAVDGEHAQFDIESIRHQIIDCALETDDDLMTRYLNDDLISQNELHDAIVSAIAQGLLTPIFCVSAKNDVGVDEFLQAFSRFAPHVGQINRHGVSEQGEDFLLTLNDDEPLMAQVFKTRIDPFVSRLSYLRIYAGRLTKDTLLYDARTGQSFKPTQIVDVQGSTYEPISEARAGDIVAIVKVDDLQIGDTITDRPPHSSLPPISYPEPMIRLAVEPKSRADQQKISNSLHKIEQEDPTFVVSRDEQTHEIVISGMSEYHLSLVEERLREREKVGIVTHLPKIPYHETLSVSVEGSYRHKKQSGGSGQFAEVHMKISPLPVGIEPSSYFHHERFPHLRRYEYDPQRNYAFVDRVSGGSIPNQYLPAIEKGVEEKLAEGVVAGCPIQDLCVEVYFGKDHPVDSNEAAFRIAARNCFKELFEAAGPMLLEPIVRIEILVPDEYLGEISGDLNSRRGRIEKMLPEIGGYHLVTASVPLSGVMTYSRILSGMTGGRGSYTLELSHYEPVPLQEQKRIIKGERA